MRRLFWFLIGFLSINVIFSCVTLETYNKKDLEDLQKYERSLHK